MKQLFVLTAILTFSLVSCSDSKKEKTNPFIKTTIERTYTEAIADQEVYIKSLQDIILDQQNLITEYRNNDSLLVIIPNTHMQQAYETLSKGLESVQMELDTTKSLTLDAKNNLDLRASRLKGQIELIKELATRY